MPEAQTLKTTGQDQKKVDWFYDALSAIYGAGKWGQTFPDELSLSKSKNLYASDICDLTKEQVQRGLKEIKRKKQSLDNNYLWPDIDTAIGCCKADGDDWEHKGAAYRIYKPEQLIAKGTQEDREKAAHKGIQGARDLLK